MIKKKQTTFVKKLKNEMKPRDAFILRAYPIQSDVPSSYYKNLNKIAIRKQFKSVLSYKKALQQKIP